MNLYSVLLKEDVALDPRTYGDLLAPMLGVTAVEARMAVRRGGGIVAESLPEEDARRLSERLQADGIGHWRVPTDALSPLHAPRRATAVEIVRDGLRCPLQGHPEPQFLPWDRIGIVSIGLVCVPELQEEFAGIRKKDQAAVLRRDQDLRDQMRDRLLAVLTRVDLSHEENAPAAGAHHYFFDQLRRRESMQLKAFLDLVSDDGTAWWRLSLEESGFTDRSDELEKGDPATLNFLAVPPVYARRRDAHTERSRVLLQGGNVERLAFKTMEDFNRYTRWWAWRERLRADPDLAIASKLPIASGNGQATTPAKEAPVLRAAATRGSGFPWRSVIAATLTLLLMIGVGGFRFERRGAVCLACNRLRQDDVQRLYGIPVRETNGEWKRTGPQSRYDEIVGADHEHVYNGFGFERWGIFGVFNSQGRSDGGNAAPETVDALECGNALLEWPAMGQASFDEVKEAYPRLVRRVRDADAAARKRWLELAHSTPDREAPENLLKELSK